MAGADLVYHGCKRSKQLDSEIKEDRLVYVMTSLLCTEGICDDVLETVQQAKQLVILQ